MSVSSVQIRPFAVEFSDFPRTTSGWRLAAPTGFTIGVGFGAVALSAIVWRCLGLAAREATPEPLSPATWITIARGSITAVLVGFVLAPNVAETTPWVPGVLFAAAVVLDGVDGHLARATDSVSSVGNRLDVEIDSFTVLVGVVLAVRIGDAPTAFLLVGAARYLFLAGIAIRRRRGRPVFELPPSTRRRAVGAATMLGIALVLLPIPGPGISWWIATLVTIPFVASFGRDWLAVTGRLPASG